MSLTRSRDLRTGFVPWTDRAGLLKAARPLRRSTRAEVVVVGAGISGALVAQSLCAAGLRPLLLDRRHGPLLGSTAASTALLLYELDQPLTRMIASVGKVRARAVWRASRVALGALIARAGELDIDADLALRPSLYLAGTMLDARGLA
ncbi:MAG: FAD-dependent oxidoreductase, partial [Steroidobacteraceae bacterium]